MSKELKVGIIVLLISALGIWGVGFLKDQSIFEATKRHFLVEYDNVEGLNEISVVTFNGKPVGKVTKIDFNPNDKTKMIVQFVMDDDITFSKSSVAKMYTASLVTGAQNIAIISKFDGEIAQSGDTLVGTKELGMVNSLTSQFTPLQNQLNKVLANAEILLGSVNKILDEKAQKSLNNSLVNFQNTVHHLNKAVHSVNSLLVDSKDNISATFANTKKITTDFSKVSEKIASTDLGKTIAQLDTTLKGVNAVISKVKNGQGTLGKLMTDDKMYKNLTNASRELEELLRDLKLNPKRFVHFSLFGKKQKPYKENNQKNISK